MALRDDPEAGKDPFKVKTGGNRNSDRMEARPNMDSRIGREPQEGRKRRPVAATGLEAIILIS